MVFKDWDSVIDTVTGDVNRLSNVWRYSSIPVLCKENVAEHLGWVCLYSLLMHSKMRPMDNYLIGAIASHAITHDITESVSGDIVRTFKYSSIELKSAINKAESVIKQQLPIDIQKLMDSHESILHAFGLEHELLYVESIVKMADFLSLWTFMRREMLRGNQEIFPYVDKMVIDLRSMAAQIASNAILEIECRQSMANFYLSISKLANVIRSRADMSNYFVGRYEE